ncbi:virion structural protein [Xanthomonas phage RTH11]|nr:virion structural protein [Xanthomonas phage RTH11]
MLARPPTFVWTEKYGQPVRNFLEGWVLMLMMDPITKAPGIIATGKRPSDLLPDYTGATMLFFEPDPTFTKVTKAWLCTNMRPNNQVAENTGRRDLTQGGESVDYSVEFTALTQVGRRVDEFAQARLNAMSLNGMNPNFQNAFVSAIDPYVRDTDNGYAEQLRKVATSGNTMP